MTTESLIYDTLKTMVGNRVYPDLAPINSQKPFMVYTQVGGESISFIDNTIPNKKHGRFQIDVYSDSRAVCAALALQVESAMVGSTVFICKAQGAPVSTYELDVLLFGSQQDFLIWSAR